MTEDQMVGYPSEVLEALVEQSESQYRRNVSKHGPGKNWLGDEARWHVWKACDELFQARDDVHEGRVEPALRHFADALNHMMFAVEIAEHAGNEDRI